MFAFRILPRSCCSSHIRAKSIHKGKVVVAMSGGIDSSAAAMLLKDAGYDCTGVFMRNWDSSDEQGNNTCSYTRDRRDMQEVCDRLQIPAVEVDFMKEYWNDVFAPFLDAYQSGKLTPNPDVQCNRFVKFQHLRNYAKTQLGADFLATGHYARVSVDNNNNNNDNNSLPPSPLLLRGLDATKDQSYFLSMTRGEDLRDVLFPVGHLLKSEVRRLVQSRLTGLAVLDKPESMGICFVGKRDMSVFLGQYLQLTPGRFLDADHQGGEEVELGKHSGSQTLTLGQRARIGGQSAKMYVVKKQQQEQGSSGDVWVSRDKSHPLLVCSSLLLRLDSFSWVSSSPPTLSLSSSCLLMCKIRHGQEVSACSLEEVRGSEGERLVKVQFSNSQWAVTDGQVLALYQGDVCLGGCVVKRVYINNRS